MSAIPGGGLAHLIVVLIHGDRGLSTTISLLNTLLGVLVLSLWLILFGWVYRLNTNIEYVIIWTTPGVIAHAGGLFINKLWPEIAQGLLTWFSRPLLLFSAILLITLGVYVNHYAFHYIDYQVVSGLCLVIFGGYCVGGLAGLVLFRVTSGEPLFGCCEVSGGGGLRSLASGSGISLRRTNSHGDTGRSTPTSLLPELSTQKMKAMAAENAVFNCLLVIPALRYALEAPDGDLAATVPLWGIFFTPAPICLYFVVHRLRMCISRFVDRRRRKQNQQFSIVTSLAKMAEGMSAVTSASGPAAVMAAAIQPPTHNATSIPSSPPPSVVSPHSPISPSAHRLHHHQHHHQQKQQQQSNKTTTL